MGIKTNTQSAHWQQDNNQRFYPRAYDLGPWPTAMGFWSELQYQHDSLLLMVLKSNKKVVCYLQTLKPLLPQWAYLACQIGSAAYRVHWYSIHDSSLGCTFRHSERWQYGKLLSDMRIRWCGHAVGGLGCTCKLTFHLLCGLTGRHWHC